MIRRTLYISLILSTCSLFGQGDKFDCNGDLIITLYGNNGGNTNAHNISVVDDLASFNDLTTYFSLLVNSTGFNSTDGYIYGISNNDHIIKLKSTGSFDDLGKPSYFPSAMFSAAGDFDSEGIYWIHERVTNSMIGIDVNSGLKHVRTLELKWHPSTGNSGIFVNDIDDVAFDPLNPTVMYTYQRYGDNIPAPTRGHLLSVDMDPLSDNYGYVFSEGPLSGETIVHLGAMFFDSKGVLFGYGSQAYPVNQNQLIKIDRNPAEAVTIAQGPSASANDGCSCPFSMYLTKATEDAYNVCLSELMRFDYVIGNSSNIVPTGVIFKDSFPTGFVIESIVFSEPFGKLTPGTGIGTNRVEITDITFSNKQVNFSIYVRPSGVSGYYSIQADLTNLPSRFGDRLVSDDPETFYNDDATRFIVDYEYFPNNFWIGNDVVMCEGGVADFFASVPIPGTEVTWNQSGIGPTYSTTQAGMIVAEAILGVCTAYDTALVDLVPYPEVDLKTDIQLCLGETLFLDGGSANSQFTYNWNNGSSTPSIQVQSGGTYILEVDDRGCKTSDTIEVEFIFEDFYLGFEDIALCEGDPINIVASNPYSVAYSWTFPDGSSIADSVLLITNAEQDAEGRYKIRMEYQGCIYENEFDVLVNPIPTIDLVDELFFDICDSINLEVATDPFVNISWSPENLVNCVDCDKINAHLTNDALITVQVIDEIGCAAYDTVQIIIGDVGLGTPLHIPNIFTPNGDNVNDEFVLLPLCYEIKEFKIYDRWGNMVYTKDMQPNSNEVRWDGFNQIGPCQNGVYAWYGIFHFLNSGEEVLYSGDVTIIR